MLLSEQTGRTPSSARTSISGAATGMVLPATPGSRTTTLTGKDNQEEVSDQAL